LDHPVEMRAAVGLYRDVLGLTATDPAVSPRLLVGLRRNGGSVIGAFARDAGGPADTGGALVGFAYGFVGRDPGTGEVYHYSQSAVVAHAWQGRGVGRLLKYGQRDFVLATGLSTMRWSYDPVRASNAHFNLDVLGARARWFVPNFYGIDDMGRDRGQPTDRLIVEWNLAGPPWPAAVEGLPERVPGWGETLPVGADLLIGIPRAWPVVASDPERAITVRTLVREAFAAAMDAGYVAVSCRIAEPGADEPGSAIYRLRPG
jgi:predicted GNAT superfamily acetyltransferase